MSENIFSHSKDIKLMLHAYVFYYNDTQLINKHSIHVRHA